MKNITMAEDITMAYAAGMIDGDGCIAVQNKRSRNNYQLRVEVGMKYNTIPNWMYEIFGGSVSTYDNNSRLMTMWTVSGYLAKDCCNRILPYLILKKMNAEVALEFPVSAHGKHLTESDKYEQEYLYRVMKELNH